MDKNIALLLYTSGLDYDDRIRKEISKRLVEKIVLQIVNGGGTKGSLQWEAVRVEHVPYITA